MNHIIDRKTQVLEALKNYRRRLAPSPEAPQLRAALFDMDGVLFDSMPAHSRSWQEAAREAGLRMSEEDAYWFEGQTGGYTITLLYQRTHGRPATPEEIEWLYQRKTELFNRYNSGKTLPGVEQVLAQLSALRRLVVTGSSQPSLLDRLDSAFPGVFSPALMVTGKDVRRGKPDPEPYLMGLEKAGVRPWEAFVVENAPMGVRSAVGAGIFTIAVNTGLLPDSALSDEGADLVFASMPELAEALPHLLALWSKAL